MDEVSVAHYFSQLMEVGLGFDLDDPNLKGTPVRVARMFCREFFKGVDKEFKEFAFFPNDKYYDQIISSNKVNFVSMCAHHFLPFTGYAWVLYIPGQRLVGASKMARLVEHYAARPQLQERLCHDVINCFVDNVQPKGVMVVIYGVHGCMKCRGVKQVGSSFGTSAVYGEFKNSLSTRQEGFDLIKLSLSMEF